jgi:hypothetical protein
MTATTTTTTLISGDTYPVKEQLKAMGGRWDADARGWRVPADRAAEAQALVGAPRAPRAPRAHGAVRRAGWRPCGYPGCSPGHCDECDGEGWRPCR